ncbi:MFS transporter [Bartonella tamiae]|uniref:Major facilitator superfamily (MFS) profile domain-containing protein n=1 Tax=Bartonella tamiae Th239 TaxID=1094558 RepID=J1JXQ4_9HYPH|nr:MFS transporter [Bartonella tamiae]EJF89395.1 hypothetical protein ME5_01946 [Bartonella tamiae Th239]EJF92740.1 hypothetical protein MEG_01910 [Bartonella tamiae Th307]
MTKRQPVRAATAAFIGTAIDWYDFYIYGTAAALIFGEIFFTSQSKFVGTLAALGTFAVGFIARPIGAIIFGHLGDKIGRKKSLVITLLMMGSATVLIGLLPTYHTIGMTAGILLIILRVVQGIAVGGEWGGAVLIAAEHAPPKWRTFLSSAPQYGSPIGLILASLAFRFIMDLTNEQLYSWGWRIPFLLSSILLIFAFIIRIGVEESPEMLNEMKNKKNSDNMPLKEVFAKKKQTLFYGIGSCIFAVAGFYFITTLMMNYTTNYIGIEKSIILDIIAWVGVTELIFFPIGAYFATRYTEKSLLLVTTALGVVWAFPMMLLIKTGDVTYIMTAILVAAAIFSAYYAVIAPYITRAFPVHMRYTGISLSYMLSGAIFGGITPMLGIWMAEKYDPNWLPLAFLFAAISLLTFLSLCFLPTDQKN